MSDAVRNGEASREGGPRSPVRRGIGRRSFLSGTAAAAAAGGTALATATVDTPPQATDTPDPKLSDYRETDHVRQFYARSRF